MKRLLTAAAASLLLTLALVAPVGAVGPGCSEFGAVTAAAAHAGGFGQVISSLATQGPGTVSGIVASEHSTMCAHP